MGGIRCLCIFVLLFQNILCSTRVDPLVDTNVGVIRGLQADDGDYSMFMGIPYAKVNVSNLFGDAIPYPPFDNIFEAYDDSAICPQLYRFNNTVLGNIDCLHLNIYVPSSATSKNRLPVMVYIHGGAFSRGAAGRIEHSPNFLVPHDVIVVTLNYRVGVYGFICLEIPEAPGNQGLKDQYLALKWIKNNIQAFGGDTDKITLFGFSAGGHSVDLHLMSPKEILYNNVILQSGSALAATVLYNPDKLAAVKIAAFLGHETNDSNEALLYLSKVNSNLVVAAALELNITFKPCAEKQFENVEPFLLNHWINTEVPKVKNVPVMIGFSEHEMAIARYSEDSEYYSKLNLVSDFLKRIFDFDEEKFIKMKDVVLHYYFGDEEMSENVKWDIIRLDSDFTYINPIQRTIRKYLKSNAGNIYYYMFSYIGGRNAIVTDEKLGSTYRPCCASHGDELNYLFDTELKPELTDSDVVVMHHMTTMWTNFAKYSDPTPETSKSLPVKWLPLTQDTYNYMHIDKELSIRSRPHHNRMAFWDLFYKHNEKSQRWYEED